MKSFDLASGLSVADERSEDGAVDFRRRDGFQGFPKMRAYVTASTGSTSRRTPDASQSRDTSAPQPQGGKSNGRGPIAHMDLRVNRHGGASLQWATLGSLALAMIAVTDRGEAARPLITDDARIVDAKACQLESWVTDDRDHTRLMALPACNFTGNLELTLGAGVTREAGHAGYSDVVAQAKTIVKAVEPNGFGIGLAAGVAHYPDSPDDARDWYVYVPMSFALHSDVALAHVNVGWQREGGTGRDHLTWGVAGEFQSTQRTALVAETFAQRDDEAFNQVGLRQWLVMNRVQLDATYGNRDGGGYSERWFSLGLRFLSAPFLP